MRTENVKYQGYAFLQYDIVICNFFLLFLVKILERIRKAVSRVLKELCPQRAKRIKMVYSRISQKNQIYVMYCQNCENWEIQIVDQIKYSLQSELELDSAYEHGRPCSRGTR